MKILVAGNERQLSDVLVVLLRQNLYEAYAVYNGNDVENYTFTGVYDAIILDIDLPGKNGVEVLRSLRKQGDFTPVLLLTDKSKVEDRIGGLECYADDYLEKPFTSGALLMRLRTITRKGIELNENELRAGNTTLDQNTHELRVEAGAIKLAAKEYQIMGMLLKDYSRVIPKERVFEQIWGFGNEAGYSNIEVYVSFIRNKLVAIGSDLQIKAVRNIGYCLESMNG